MSIITQILEFLKDRIQRNLLTTVLGVLIIIASIASHFLMDTSWTEVLIGVCVGIILLPMKDPKAPLGTAVLIILGLLLGACKTVKSTSSQQSKVVTDTDSLTKELMTSLHTIEYFNDEISGFIPIRINEIPDYDSLIIPVRSKGIDMELIVKRTGITYNTKVKPVARSSLQKQVAKETSSQSNVSAVVKEQSKEVVKPASFRLPWWLWLILILVALFSIARLLNIIKNPLKIL